MAPAVPTTLSTTTSETPTTHALRFATSALVAHCRNNSPPRRSNSSRNSARVSAGPPAFEPAIWTIPLSRRDYRAHSTIPMPPEQLFALMLSQRYALTANTRPHLTRNGSSSFSLEEEDRAEGSRHPRHQRQAPSNPPHRSRLFLPMKRSPITTQTPTESTALAPATALRLQRGPLSYPYIAWSIRPARLSNPHHDESLTWPYSRLVTRPLTPKSCVPRCDARKTTFAGLRTTWPRSSRNTA